MNTEIDSQKLQEALAARDIDTTSWGTKEGTRGLDELKHELVTGYSGLCETETGLLRMLNMIKVLVYVRHSNGSTQALVSSLYPVTLIGGLANDTSPALGAAAAIAEIFPWLNGKVVPTRWLYTEVQGPEPSTEFPGLYSRVTWTYMGYELEGRHYQKEGYSHMMGETQLDFSWVPMQRLSPLFQSLGDESLIQLAG